MRLQSLRLLLGGVLFAALLPPPGFAESPAGAEIFSNKCDLVIAGTIGAGDDKRFKAILAGLFRSECEFAPRIFLYSTGGDLRAAIRIGRQINALYLTTVAPELVSIPRVDESKPRKSYRRCPNLPQNGQGDPRCTCGSACFFIWAAGTERQGDVLLIHRPYFDPLAFAKLDAADAKTAYQELTEEARSFLSEVGVQPAIIERMFNTSSDQASYLSAQELQHLRMPAYLSELRLAKCGPEPREEEYSSVTDISKCNIPLVPLTGPYRWIPSQSQCYGLNHALWEARWQQALKAFRQRALADYLSADKP